MSSSIVIALLLGSVLCFYLASRKGRKFGFANRWRGGRGAIYAASVVHPITGLRCRYGYLGKTRQRPSERWAQHEGRSSRYRGPGQPWSDTIIEWRVVKSFEHVSDAGLWWAEVWRIVLFLPLYNYQWNTHNPRRIPKYVAARRYRSPLALRKIAQLSSDVRLRSSRGSAKLFL